MAVDGRGVIASAAAYRGSSGGPLLDEKGHVIGVLSTLIGHQRERGTAVPANMADRYVVAAVPDARTRAIVLAAR